MSFPTSPTNGEVTVVNGIKYIYAAATSSWTRVPLNGFQAAASAPSNPKAGDQWYNTNTDIIFEYITDGVSSYWVDVSSLGQTGNITNVIDSTLSGNVVLGLNDVYSIGASTGYLQNFYSNNIFGNTVYAGNSIGNAIVAAGNIVPATDVTYSLGTTDSRFSDIWLSGSTIYLGAASISTDGANITITNPEGGSFNISGSSPIESSAVGSGGGGGGGGSGTPGGSTRQLQYNDAGSFAGANIVFTKTTGNLVVTATTSSTNASTGALVLKGGMGVTGNVYATRLYTTSGLFWAGNNASYTTGAASGPSSTNTFATWHVTGQSDVVAGGEDEVTFTGVGISITTQPAFPKTLTFGIDLSQGANIGAGSTTGNLVATATTISTSTDTGALVVTGGAGIAGALYIENTGDVSANIGTLFLGNELTQANLGAYQTYANATFSVSTYGNSNVASYLTLGANIGSGSATSNLVAAATTTAISTTTGALVVRGGAGLAGNVYAGGNIYASQGLSVGTTLFGAVGEIRATNNITAYYSSDRRLKSNIIEIPNALTTVTTIGGKLFEWTDEYINTHGGEDGYFVCREDFGVIAQDVQSVFPRAVRTRDNGTLAVDYEKLSALAFAAIAELSLKVDQLTEELEKLKKA